MVEHSQDCPKEDQEEQPQQEEAGHRARDHRVAEGRRTLDGALQPVQDIMATTLLTIAVFFAIVAVSTMAKNTAMVNRVLRHSGGQHHHTGAVG